MKFKETYNVRMYQFWFFPICGMTSTVCVDDSIELIILRCMLHLYLNIFSAMKTQNLIQHHLNNEHSNMFTEAIEAALPVECRRSSHVCIERLNGWGFYIKPTQPKRTTYKSHSPLIYSDMCAAAAAFSNILNCFTTQSDFSENLNCSSLPMYV